MAFKRVTLLIIITLLLAGCYRQAGDDFVTVDSGNAGDTGAPEAATATDDTPVIIEPDDAPTDMPDESATTDAGAQQLDETPAEVIDDTDAATPTIIIFEVATDTPGVEPSATFTGTPVPSPAITSPTLLPTATEVTLITPDVGGPAQIDFPTATPTEPVTPTDDSTEADDTDSADTDSDTDTAEAVPGQDCIYVVTGGDNLFRIAINNNVSLNALLQANNLSETSIIQPGQELTIPDCTPEESAADSAPADDDTDTNATALPDGSLVHTVSSGETLSVIARRYGVSMQAIIDATGLTNPDALSIGQELIIPGQ